MSRYQLSTTFPIDEVRILLVLARTLQRGGDVSTIMRHPNWANVVRKFQRMEQKWSAKPPIDEGTPPPTAPRELDPAPGPPTAPSSSPDYQYFRNQGYNDREIENILQVLKKDEK